MRQRRARNDLGLPPEKAVPAPALKAAGYATALIGKWHMGCDPKFNPLDQGFDRFFGILGGNVEYYRHRETWLFDLSQNPREQHDLLPRHPGAAARLQALLGAWEQEIRAER